ncbi:zinc finger BED domain-containing protein DAYSLEEPER isoform X1 [Beta vulgaris subsp. vulgaris]|uniref:zinc finger BED domain-containing protein DAYSLEEPER isoform X1 n=2 Tax=Beta vulgaris subsp. vulgaris TaxID=3555 RepID=UPI002036CEA8|nr:zinc finger BED domain-containing protein DAYSLEEPER isoform X1 [Beta vulgaris subsp. vulgaris]
MSPVLGSSLFCSMTTTDENNEMVDSKHADEQSEFETSQARHSVKVKPERAVPEPMEMEEALPMVEQADPQTVGEPVNSGNVNSELAGPEPLGEDAVHSPPVNSEDMHPEVVNSEHMQSQAFSSEVLHSQPVSTELVHSHPIAGQVVHSQPGSADLMYSEPLSSTNESNQLVDPKQADVQPRESGIGNLQAENCVTVKPERAEPVTMDVEVANSQCLGEEVGPHSVCEEHASAELAHPEPLGEEAVYPVSSEAMHPQLVNSGHAHSPVSSEQIHAQTVTAENMHSQPVSLEHMPSQPVSSEQIESSELVHSQAVSDGHVHAHLVAAEVVHSQPGDIVYSQPLGSDIVHSQPVSTELVHIQHANVEPVHLQSVGLELVNSHGHGGELVNSHALGMELINTQPLSTELPNSQLATPETQPNKRRKKKSIVWEHFTIETVGVGCRRAYCKVCKQSFAYSTGSKVAGTSHLKRHIAKGTCPVVLRQQEKNQLSPYMPKTGGTDAGTEHQPKRRYRSSSSPYLIFDQDRCRHEIAKMIIMHDYPLHMVEHPGFVSFVQNLQPRFDMVSFNIVQGDCVAIFLREKQNLQRFIEGIPGRICLTLDMWTSSQSTGYVFVTGQYIDNDWKLHRRLLNVVMEPFPESDRALSHAIGTCLSDWGFDRKLFTITFNQPLGEAALENLRALLAVKNPMLFDGQLLIQSCIARTLSSMAQEVITASEVTIKKIRTSVKYVKTSESHEEKFLELKQQLQVPTEKSLSLDNVTKWNTTYEMLLAASELKQVFSCLDTCDPDYKDAPSMEDWSLVENICMYLKLLYDTVNLLLAKPTPSSNVFFHEVWKIQLELARAAASDDLFVAGLAKPLQDKFHKYWKNSCLVLAVAVAMDPRFKMKLVEFSFTKIFMDEAPHFIRVVDDGIHELFHEYMNHPLPLTPVRDGNGGYVKGEDSEGGNLLNSNGLSDFDMYIMETSSQQMKSELDQYLEESLLPRIQDFDVLGWWKLNKLKYPTLSKMARDILSMPLSTVSAESVFDTSFKEMDSYRCSLRPETLEALICAKDWLQPDSTKASSKELVKMEL